MNAYPERRRVASQAGTQLFRLLVVDDDENYRAYVAAVARRQGFVVSEAGDGKAGLAMLMAPDAYDVVIVDQEMPRMSGIEVVRALRGDPAAQGVYALMLTAHDDMRTKLAALDAGFDDFVAKSAAEPEIAARVVAARRIAARQKSLNGTIRELRGLATRDDLTGVFNRRFFIAEAERLIAEEAAVNLLFFDLDDFKQVNDTHGHLAGDAVLRDVGALFHRNTRPEDIVARIGGDEFVIMISNAAVSCIERIVTRLASDIEALRWAAGEKTFGIGVSTGIASSHLLAKPSLEQLLDAADRDMYKNKWMRMRSERKPAAAPRPEARA